MGSRRQITMFFDLDVPLPTPATQIVSGQTSKKGKKKQPESFSESTPPLVFTSGQIAAIETRIDLLVRLGYTVFALNQIVQSKVDSRTHVDWLRGLLPKLKKRSGITLLKRLTVVLDEESDKGSGINPQNTAVLSQYDILSLRPTTQSSFSQACLMHSTPSPHTVHIISMPVTLPRLPFHLKHTLIRTALKNGAVFEIDYVGAVGPEFERRNWWGGSREVMRVTKGKGVLLSGGVIELQDVRAPRDAANLITLLGIPQNLSHDANTITAKAVVLRAQTRRTYRSTLSEPKLIMPSSTIQPPSSDATMARDGDAAAPSNSQSQERLPLDFADSTSMDATSASGASLPVQQQREKRQCEENQHPSGRSKKRKKNTS